MNQGACFQHRFDKVTFEPIWKTPPSVVSTRCRIYSAKKKPLLDKEFPQLEQAQSVLQRLHAQVRLKLKAIQCQTGEPQAKPGKL